MNNLMIDIDLIGNTRLYYDVIAHLHIHNKDHKSYLEWMSGCNEWLIEQGATNLGFIQDPPIRRLQFSCMEDYVAFKMRYL